MPFTRVAYEDLNPKQQERYNFQKVSAVLADFGYITIALSDDWNGADFLALHRDGETLKVQLKGRMTFKQNYLGKDLYIAFPSGDTWYMYPHDQMLELISANSNVLQSDDWKEKGSYTFPRLSVEHKRLLSQFEIKETLDVAA